VSRADAQATLVVLPPASDQPPPAPPAEADDAAEAGGAAAPPPRPAANRPMVAVLPFANMTGDPAQEYFADGMTEELTTTLTKIEALRVIAHQSVLQFKHSTQAVPEIARSLGVKYVVDGSVLQDGDRVRITASLVDAARNTPVWGERFERERRDVMALQREVALAIARAIELALTPQDQARLPVAPEVDPEAFDLYVKGTQARHRAAASATGDFREAVEYFARAIAEDSGYAPAYAGSAFAHAISGDEAQARRFAAKALELDPALAEAHMVLGLVRQFFDRDWAGAENALRQAIRLNPGYAEAHHELSMLLMRRRRSDEAVREAQYTLYLAPMSARFEIGMGEIYYHGGRYGDVLGAGEKALALDSSSSAAPARRLIGAAYAQLGEQEKAVAMMKACGCLGDLGYVYAVSGKRDAALEIIDTLTARWRRGDGFPAYRIAEVYMGLGDRKQALDWLERIPERGPGSILRFYVGIEPLFRPLHAEPRFQALLKKVGLAD
jgi:TolB-like protein/Tfp pilus assembly protein PilF